MTTKLNLLLSILITCGMEAQQANIMKNQNSNATSEIIHKGKLVYTEIQINATAEKIWSVFSDFENYPNWNPFIKSLKGHPKRDTTIQVQLQPPGKKPMLFKPRVLRFEKEKEFRWIGKFILPRLFDGEHAFQIIQNSNGTCTFIQYEHFRGLLIPLLRNMLDNNTRKGFEAMNLALKERCEMR